MRRVTRLVLTVLFWGLWMSCAHAAGAPESTFGQAPQPAAPSGNAPVLQMDQTTFDAGDVYEGEVVTHEFKVKNAGSAVLEINQVRPG